MQVAGKLNDIQANKLLSNMKKMENFYFPPAAFQQILQTLQQELEGLDKEGLMSLRQQMIYHQVILDLPPPGSRGHRVMLHRLRCRRNN